MSSFQNIGPITWRLRRGCWVVGGGCRGGEGVGGGWWVGDAGVRERRVEGQALLARDPRSSAPRSSRRDRWAPRDNARHHRAQTGRGGSTAEREGRAGGAR